MKTQLKLPKSTLTFGDAAPNAAMVTHILSPAVNLNAPDVLMDAVPGAKLLVPPAAVEGLKYSSAGAEERTELLAT